MLVNNNFINPPPKYYPKKFVLNKLLIFVKKTWNKKILMDGIINCTPPYHNVEKMSCFQFSLQNCMMAYIVLCSTFKKVAVLKFIMGEIGKTEKLLPNFYLWGDFLK